MLLIAVRVRRRQCAPNWLHEEVSRKDIQVDGDNGPGC